MGGGVNVNFDVFVCDSACDRISNSLDDLDCEHLSYTCEVPRGRDDEKYLDHNPCDDRCDHSGKHPSVCDHSGETCTAQLCESQHVSLGHLDSGMREHPCSMDPEWTASMAYPS